MLSISRTFHPETRSSHDFCCFTSTSCSKLARLEQLEELDLSGNRLRAVPTTILNCQRLHTLSAHSNCINAFPEVLQLPEIKVSQIHTGICLLSSLVLALQISVSRVIRTVGSGNLRHSGLLFIYLFFLSLCLCVRLYWNKSFVISQRLSNLWFSLNPNCVIVHQTCLLLRNAGGKYQF